MKLEFELVQSEIDHLSISDLLLTLNYFENIKVLGDWDFTINNSKRKELFRNEIVKRIQEVLKVKEL